MSDSGYRIVEHPADVGFEVWAPTFPALLHEAVRALAEVQSGGAPPAGAERRASPQGPEDEDTLVAVLDRCLYEMDTDRWLAVGHADGELVGERLSDEVRERGVHVKAVTWHHLRVERVAAGWQATIFVDL